MWLEIWIEVIVILAVVAAVGLVSSGVWQKKNKDV